MKTRIAVLITCFNRKKTTLRCLGDLQSLRTDRGFEFDLDVFLVDDGSTDGTSDAVRVQYPAVRILTGNGSLYWNRGMYLAFSEALKGDFDNYLWLNDDTHLYPNALIILLKTQKVLLDGGHDLSIVAGATKDPAKGHFTYGGVVRDEKWYGYAFKRMSPSPKAIIPLDATNGNCVLIPRSVASRVGNLDPVFKHRWGDHDYCFRARNRGCEVWLASEYVGVCARNTSAKTWRDVKLPLISRYRLLWEPTGLMPNDYWKYLKRHRGWAWLVFALAPFFQIPLSSLRYFITRKEA